MRWFKRIWEILLAIGLAIWAIATFFSNASHIAAMIEDPSPTIRALGQFAAWLFSTPWWVPAVLATVLTAFLIWRSKQETPFEPKSSVARYADKDTALIDAISWIANRSAWGRWQKVLTHIDDGYVLLQSASGFALKAAANGELAIRGKLAGSLEYKEIDRHFWVQTAFRVEPDNAHLWRVVVIPRSGVTDAIPNYDSLLVEQSRVEELWPSRDWKTDWATTKFRIRDGFRRDKVASFLTPSRMIVGFVGIALVAWGLWGTFRHPKEIDVATLIAKATAPIQKQLNSVTRERDAALRDLAAVRQSEGAQKTSPPVAPQDRSVDGPITWNKALGWSLTGDQAGPILLAIEITGTNTSTAPVQLRNAYVVSGKNGTRQEMKVFAGADGKISIGEMNPIPPAARFILVSDFLKGLHVRELMDQWGSIYFFAEYDDKKYQKLFDENDLANGFKDYLGPHVSKKQGQ